MIASYNTKKVSVDATPIYWANINSLMVLLLRGTAPCQFKLYATTGFSDGITLAETDIHLELESKLGKMIGGAGAYLLIDGEGNLEILKAEAFQESYVLRGV